MFQIPIICRILNNALETFLCPAPISGHRKQCPWSGHTKAGSQVIRILGPEWARRSPLCFWPGSQRVRGLGWKGFWNMLGKMSNSPEQWRDRLGHSASKGIQEAASQFPRATATKHHGLGGRHKGSLPSPRVGGWKSKRRRQAGLVPSEDRGGEFVPGLSPWPVNGHLHVTWLSPAGCLCPNCPSVQGHRSC